MAFTLPQVPFKLTPEDMGSPDLLSALTKGINLGYLPREKEAGLQSSLLKNIYQTLINKNYEPNIQSEIGLRNAQRGLTNEQTKYFGRTAESEIGLRGAQSNLVNQQAKFTPLDAYSKAASALKSSSRAQRGKDWMDAVKLLPVADRGAYLAQHAADFHQAIADLASENNNAPGNQQNQNPIEAAIMQEIQKQRGINPSSFNPAQMNQQPSTQQEQIPAGTPNSPQQQNQSAPSNVQNAVMNQLPVEDRPVSNDPDIKAAQDKLNNAKFSSSKDQTQQLADYGTLNSINKLSSPAMKARVDGAKVLETFLKEMRTPENMQRFLNVAKQAGQLSQAERMAQEVLPENMQSQSYKDYLWYTDVFQKAVTSTVKQMEKLNGDKKQIQMLQELTGMLYSPHLGQKGALKNFNESIRTLQKMSKSIFDSAEPTYAKGIHKRMYNLPGEYDNYASKDATKMAIIIDPSGGEHEVPEENVEAAIKLHPGTKRKK